MFWGMLTALQVNTSSVLPMAAKAANIIPNTKAGVKQNRQHRCCRIVARLNPGY